MRPDPVSTPRERAEAPEERILDVSHGPAFGIWVALPWALVAWAALVVIAVIVLA